MTLTAMTKTTDVYQKLPLATLTPKERGDLLEKAVRYDAVEETTGEKTYDPDAGETHTGKKRGRNQAPFDFYLGDGRQRVEVKSAQLRWNKHDKYWQASFQGVKRAEYDLLYLALYTPSGIYVFKHDDEYGISTHGKQQESCGGYINVYGPRNEESIEEATRVVLEKMGSMFVKHIPLDTIEITRNVTRDSYKDVPFATLSPKERGDILEKAVRDVVEETTGEKTYDPDPGKRINGKKRGRNSAPFDFYLGDGRQRVEVKSSQLSWCKFFKRWYASFQHVKRAEYDLLYLALYTPSGIYVFKHNDEFGKTTHGKQQESRGGQIQVYGPKYEESIEEATKVVLKKMGSMHVKTIKFNELKRNGSFYKYVAF